MSLVVRVFPTEDPKHGAGLIVPSIAIQSDLESDLEFRFLLSLADAISGEDFVKLVDMA